MTIDRPGFLRAFAAHPIAGRQIANTMAAAVGRISSICRPAQHTGAFSAAPRSGRKVAVCAASQCALIEAHSSIAGIFHGAKR